MPLPRPPSGDGEDHMTELVTCLLLGITDSLSIETIRENRCLATDKTGYYETKHKKHGFNRGQQQYALTDHFLPEASNDFYSGHVERNLQKKLKKGSGNPPWDYRPRIFNMYCCHGNKFVYLNSLFIFLSIKKTANITAITKR